MSDENQGPDDSGRSRPVNDAHKRTMDDLFGDLDDSDDGDDVTIESLREERDGLLQKVADFETLLSSVRADNKDLIRAVQSAKDDFEELKKNFAAQQKQTVGKFVNDLKPVVATLEEGLKAIEADRQSEVKFTKLADGVEKTVSQLEAVFNKYASRHAVITPVTEDLKNEPAAEPDKNVCKSPSTEDTLDSLDLECAELEKRMIDLGNALTRAQADQQTLGKKLEETKISLQRDAARLEGEQKFAVEKFVKDLLLVIDTLDLGLQAIRKDKSGEPKFGKLGDGVERTLMQLKSVFNAYGVFEINPLNQAFDDNKHEVITTQARPGVEPETVIVVHQKGYEIEGRLIRPAKVIVTPSE